MRNRSGPHISTVIVLSLIIFNAIFNGSPSTALAETPGKAKPEMAKLTIGLPVPSISFLPVWVADQNGFLKEEGITDAKILAFRGDADVIQALAAGTVDLNVASLTGLVSTINSGQKFKGFGPATTCLFLIGMHSQSLSLLPRPRGSLCGIQVWRSHRLAHPVCPAQCRP